MSSSSASSFASRPEDRLGDEAGERAGLAEQDVGARARRKPICSGDRLGEGREAAGDQRRVGAGRAHRGDQERGARHDLDPLRQHLRDDLGSKALQQGDALPQRRLESDLAAHGALGDAGDFVAQPDLGGQLVDAFLLDQGGIHVGDEEPLAAEVRRHDVHVDRPVPQRRAGGGQRTASARLRTGISQASPGESQSGSPGSRPGRRRARAAPGRRRLRRAPSNRPR